MRHSGSEDADDFRFLFRHACVPWLCAYGEWVGSGTQMSPCERSVVRRGGGRWTWGKGCMGVFPRGAARGDAHRAVGDLNVYVRKDFWGEIWGGGGLQGDGRNGLLHTGYCSAGNRVASFAFMPLHGGAK